MDFLSPKNKDRVKQKYSLDKFPIGDYYNWHGGVHVTRGPITAIAEGTIIAYRVPDDYVQEKVNDREHIYSTGFVLVRHRYLSLKKQSLVFYSLYGNLLPLKKYNSKQDIPVFGIPLRFKAPSLTEGKTMKGIMLFDKEETKTDKGTEYTLKEIWVIPTGAKVTVDTTDTISVLKKNQKVRYVKVRYTRWGKTQEGYLRDGTGYIKKREGETCHTVVFEPSENIQPLDSGLIVYAENKSRIQEIIPEGTEFTLDAVNGDWGILKHDGKTGYIKMEDLKEQFAWREDIEKDCICNCRIPVNAGACLGQPGYNDKQMLSHVEIFTPEDESALQDFLNNSLKDGLDKHGRAGLSGFVRLPDQLSNYLPYTLLGGTSVKMIKKGKRYSRVEIGTFQTQAHHSELNMPATFQGNTFTVNRSTRVNDKFDGILVPGDTLSLSDAAGESVWGSLHSWKPVINLHYAYPVTGQEFYIENKYLSRIFDFPRQLDEEEKWCITSGNASKPDAKTELRLYLDMPDPDRSAPDRIKLPGGVVLGKKDVIVYKQNHRKDSWYYIRINGPDANGMEVRATGFVNCESVEEYSPHDWSEFGFRILKPDDPDQYLCLKIKTGLIGQLLNLTDTKGKKIWEGTFNHHLADNVDIISRQVIFHRSEWSYGFPDVEGKIRNEIKDYFVSIVNPNLSTPIDEDVLEQKIDFYIRKIKNLGFWDQIRVDTSPREGEEDLEAFPQSPHVFHFHPYAFIVQMNRMLDVCPDCGKKHIDLRNKIKYVSQFDIRFGDKKDQNKACYKACLMILRNSGLSEKSAQNIKSNMYQVARAASNPAVGEQSDYLEIDKTKASEGLTYMNQQLEEGFPVLVGVDYKSEESPNSDDTTDHFIVIIGRGCSENGQYYIFYEVGSYYKTVDDIGKQAGQSDKNKLYLKKDGTLQGSPVSMSHKNYIVVQIRKNILK